MPRFAASCFAIVALGLGPVALAGADDAPPPLVFTASDLLDLADGLPVPEAGDYAIKVWAGGRVDWTLKVEGNRLTLIPRAGRADSAPRWVSLGTARLAAQTPTILTVAPLPPGAIPAKGPRAEPPRPPVPAVLTLATDPDFTASRALDLIRGQLSGDDPPPDARRTTVRTNYQGADFEPPASPEAWRDRARTVRERLLVAAGLWPMPPKTELGPRVVGTLDRDGYAIDKVVLETLPGFHLAGNLYRPTNGDGRRPVVLCPHGHSPEGRVNGDVQSRCVRLAQLGCVVFLYDMVGYADAKPFGHAFLSDRLRRAGLSLVTLQTWNSIRALDWVTSRPDVDAARVAVTGESGGATQTLLLTAIDDRVKVAAPVVMVSDGFQGGCACENAAGLRLGTDNVEIAALAAPRPLKLVGATGDWTARTMTNAYPTLQLVYGRVGAVDRVSADVFDFPHNYNRTSRDAVYAFLGRWFLGVADVASTREGTVKVEAPADLLAFDAAHPYPADAKTPEQLETELIGVLDRQLARLAPGTVAAPWEAARDRLMTALKVRVGVEHPTPRQATAREVRRLERDGLAIAHHVVGRKAAGDLIPVVRLSPARADGRLTVLFTPRGKADLASPDGTPAPLARAILARGQSVVGFDPLLIGESVDPAAPTTRRPATAHFEAYNPSLAADRMQDLATVLAWARALPDVREVHLVATGAAGPLALLARPALEGLARTVIDLDEFQYAHDMATIPPALDLPGVLQFGGLPAAAALTAPAPLWIARVGGNFDATPALKAYALADSAPQIRLDRGPAAGEAIARWLDGGD